MINLTELKNIVTNNQKVSQIDAASIILPILKKIPAPVVSVNKNTLIERAVSIDRSQSPFDLDRLSYIPDKLKRISKEGRFNKDLEPAFYGAFTDLEIPQLTRYFLAFEIEQNLSKIENHTFRFTISKWFTINSFDAIQFIFDERYCNNILTKTAFHAFQSNLDYINLSNDEKEALRLITIELAKPSPINGYVISNVIFDFYKNKKYGAIIYPGVQSKYRGNNIALVPYLVDKNFSFFLGAEFELIKRKKKIEIKDLYGLKISNGKLDYFEFEVNEKDVSESFPT